MRRAHRKAHFLIWLIVGPCALIGLFLGVKARVDMPVQTPPASDSPPLSNPPATEVVDQ